MFKVLYSKIKRHLRTSLKKNKDVLVSKILVLHDNLKEDSLYIRGLKELEEDFIIEFVSCSQEKISSSFLNSYDFVIVISSFLAKPHTLVTRLKAKTLFGLLILDETPPKNNKNFKFYDVIWFSTYPFSKSIDHPLKIHASYSKDNPQSFWDLKYFCNQIRLGLNAFRNENIRSTNLIESSEKLKVGRHSFYNRNFLVTGDENVSIGSFCSIGKSVAIYTANHDTNYASTQGFIYRKYFGVNHPGEDLPNPSRARTKGPVIIKNDVWIGDGVKIMSGVTIGNGACIAAGSIVTKDVKDYEVVGGNPAKKIKMRFDNEDLIKYLLKIEWWNWSDKKIQSNKEFFLLNLNNLNDLDKVIIK